MSSQATLRDVLESYGGEYSRLFTSGQILQKDGGWKISCYHLKAKNHAEFFQQLAADISAENLTDITDPDALIKRINEVWHQRARFKSGPNSDDGTIDFSSRIEGYNFLSNFFPTLIVMDGRVFTSAEHLYQTLVADELVPGVDHRDQTQGFPAMDVKNYGRQIQEAWAAAATGPEKKAFVDRKLKIMPIVVSRKFDLNPVLREALLATHPHSLVEATDSMLWGRGRDGTGQNHLGHILERHRSHFSDS